jgi:hypothetical protein
MIWEKEKISENWNNGILVKLPKDVMNWRSGEVINHSLFPAIYCRKGMVPYWTALYTIKRTESKKTELKRLLLALMYQKYSHSFDLRTSTRLFISIYALDDLNELFNSVV